MSREMRSRAVRRFFLCCRRAASAPPPCRICSSCARISSARAERAEAMFKQALPSGRLFGPHLPLPRRRDAEHLAILGHGAASNRIAGLAELADQVLVGERVGLV